MTLIYPRPSEPRDACPYCDAALRERYDCGCQLYECDHVYDCDLGWVEVQEIEQSQ